MVVVNGRGTDVSKIATTTYIGAIAIEDLVVVLDLENAVLDNAHGEFRFAVDQKPESHKVLSSAEP